MQGVGKERAHAVKQARRLWYLTPYLPRMSVVVRGYNLLVKPVSRRCVAALLERCLRQSQFGFGETLEIARLRLGPTS